MTFPIRNHTSLKPATRRYNRLVHAATLRAVSFAAVNTHWGESTFIMLAWRGNEYVARIKYTSNQGTGHVDTIFETSLEA